MSHLSQRKDNHHRSGSQGHSLYKLCCPLYDIFVSPFFNFGRRASISRMNIQPGDRVLEVGCGTGTSFPYFKPYFEESGQLVGMDLSTGMLTQALKSIRRNQSNFVDLGCCCGESLPFPAATFDSIFAAYTFTVVPNPDTFLKEVLRVARPGGKIVFLNHLKSRNRLLGKLEEVIDPVTKNIGWQMKEDLREIIYNNKVSNFTEEGLKTNPLFKIISFNKP